MKLGLVIATYGRPELLQQVLAHLMSQRRVPDEIVISAARPSDIPAAIDTVAKVHKIFGSVGLCSQRNRGISCLIGTMDIIAFIDDDFIVGDDYFLDMETLFEQDVAIIGVNAWIMADGANSSGFTFEEGLHLKKQYGQQKKTETPLIQEIKGKYADGCNGIIAFRSAGLGELRFDERLALYGWQEDLDFCGALLRRGRIVRANQVWGVHLGAKSGKGSEIRLGYSQIVNPAYIACKGNMSFGYAVRLPTRNFIANLIRSFWPEPYINRRARLRGNLIGIFHLTTGRLTPEYILRMKEYRKDPELGLP
jgi:GT2 family glycosyltransferase